MKCPGLRVQSGATKAFSSEVAAGSRQENANKNLELRSDSIGTELYVLCGRWRYFAATTMISTLYCGAASLASTVARAGVLPADTQPSHTAFISGKVFMSVM
jgi:hypothetical protein